MPPTEVKQALKHWISMGGGGGDQGRYERRSEVFVKFIYFISFFLGGGGGGGRGRSGGGEGSVRGGGGGGGGQGVSVDVNGEVKFL